MDPGSSISTLLGWAVVLPLCSFFVILVFGPRMGKAGEHAASLATAAIGVAAVLSFISLVVWLTSHRPGMESHGEVHASVDFPVMDVFVRGQDPHAEEKHKAGGAEDASVGDHHHEHQSQADASHGHGGAPLHYTNDFTAPAIGGPWVLGEFGSLRLSISYYIDALTVCMFCMVTFIATLIHVYAMGYMHDELHDITDHEVTLSDGEHLRPSRSISPLLSVPFVILLQYAGPRHRR